MIDSIALKDIATYDSIGIEIKNLKKVNFIYGANGSGKTTITNFLNSPDSHPFEECNLTWENGSPMKVLVYNKDFKERNFGKGKMNGVFTIGDATKEQLTQIQTMQTKLDQIKETGIQKKSTIEKQEKKKSELEIDFQENSWKDIYKKYETIFNVAFDGFKSKERFKNKLLSEYKTNKKKDSIKFEELQRKAEIIFNNTPQVINLIALIDFDSLIKIEKNIIWSKKIIGKTDVEIAKLIQRLNLNDWVNQGRQYMEEESEICPFCQKKTIDSNFKIQLEQYFDETFIAANKLIKALYDQYIIESQSLYFQLQEIESRAANENSKLDILLFSAYLKTLNQQFISNKELLNNKLKEPSRSIDIISTEDQLKNIQKLIYEANVEIQKHNKLVSNFQEEKTNLIADIWCFLTNENNTNIDAFIKKTEGLQKGIETLESERKKLRDEYNKLEREIKDANKHVTSIQPSIDAINGTLKAYDFTNFKIVASKAEPNQYQIEREDGSIAEKTLSEGEATFITFLYFLQLAKGGVAESSTSDDRILVIDDPISSLDSTVLFVVSSLIKEIIKDIKKGRTNIKQLILFTHNVYFHKEVSFVDRSDNNRDDVSYWMLRKNGNISSIQPFGKKNPIRGSYELLWDELKNMDNLSGITIQNTMRRILETYFKTMGGYKDDNLIESFDKKQEQEICRSLICWVNDGSHCISDDLHVEYPDIINERYLYIFRKIFENMGHIGHYNMMMGISPECEEKII